jgi:hypothetical protein
MAYVAAHYIDSADVRFYIPEGSTRLRAEIRERQTVLSAKVKRIFPLSNPKVYFAIIDGGDKEVGILRDIDKLDRESKEVLDRELDRRYFTPQVQQIKALKQDGGMWLFSVVTQRGTTDFYVRNWRDNSQEIQPGRWQIQSVDGQRYEIPHIDSLNSKSQKLLEQLL